MNKYKRKLLISIIIVLLSAVLIGCGNDVRDGAGILESERVLQQGGASGNTVSVLTIPEMWYNGSIYLKRWAPVVIVGSIVVGWVIYDLFEKVREIQKLAFSILIVKVPVFTFLIVYIYSWLYRMLNF